MTLIDPYKSVKDLLLFAKREGVSHFKLDTLEFSFGVGAPIGGTVGAEQMKIPVEGMPSDEELLFASATDSQIDAHID